MAEVPQKTEPAFGATLTPATTKGKQVTAQDDSVKPESVVTTCGKRAATGGSGDSPPEKKPAIVTTPDHMRPDPANGSTSKVSDGGYYTGHDLEGDGFGVNMVGAGLLAAHSVPVERKVSNAKGWARREALIADAATGHGA